MENAGIARVLVEMADLSEMEGQNVFKIRAFRNAAEVVATLPFDLEPLCATPEKLLEIRGIGEGIAKKIIEICKTGSCAEHRDLSARVPPTLIELLSVEGVGPKK